MHSGNVTLVLSEHGLHPLANVRVTAELDKGVTTT